MQNLVTLVANAHYINPEDRERLLNEFKLVEALEDLNSFKDHQKRLLTPLRWWILLAIGLGISSGIFTSVIYLLTSVK